MEQLKFLDEILPFTCGNTDCRKEYDLEAFVEVALLWGFIYLVCTDDENELAILGLTCPDCTKTTINKYPLDTAMLFQAKFNRALHRRCKKEGGFLSISFERCVYFSYTLLKHWGLIQHTLPQDIDDNEKQYTIPEGYPWLGYLELIFNIPYIVPECILQHLLQIENNHGYKAVPRIVESFCPYSSFDNFFIEKNDSDINETLVLNLIQPNTRKSTLSTQYGHMIDNDLSENEYKTLGLDLFASETKSFQDNIDNCRKDARKIRNKINFEIIFRSQFINKYARKMYQGPGLNETILIESELDAPEPPEWAISKPSESPSQDQTIPICPDNKESETNQAGSHTASHLESFVAEQNASELKDIDNAFSNQGSIWIVKFKGNTATVAATKRLFYLACLIKYPGRKIDNEKLQKVVDELYDNGTFSNEDLFIGSPGSSDSYDISMKSRSEILEQEKRIKKSGNECLKQLSQAEKKNDTEAIRELDEYLNNLIAACTELDGKPNIEANKKGVKKFYPNLIKISKVDERTRKNIGNNIRNVLKDIEKMLPALSQYLEKRIKREQLNTGFFPQTQTTEKSLKWEVFLTQSK